MMEHSDGKTEAVRDRKSASAVSNPTVVGIGGGIAAGIASSFIPMSAIEGFVTAYGIAELLPAAAPPLGTTARLALSTGIGTLTAGALLALLPRGETHDMVFKATVLKGSKVNAQPEKATSPAESDTGGKFGGWLRTLRFGKTAAGPGEIVDFADLERTRVRSADRHPDAPIRAPILASSDLGDPLDTPFSAQTAAVATDQNHSPADVAPVGDHAAPFDLRDHMTVATEESPVEHPSPSIEPADRAEPRADGSDVDVTGAARVRRPFSLRPPEFEPAPEQAESTVQDGSDHRRINPEPINELYRVRPPVDEEPLDTLSIADLLERLENGLQRRIDQAPTSMTVTGRMPMTDRNLIRLPAIHQQAPATPAFAQPTSVESTAAVAESLDDTGPFRFSLDRSTDANSEAPSRLGSLGERGSWNDDVEYQPPFVAMDSIEQPTVPSAPLPKLDQGTSTQTATAAPPPNPADDDMDAALRDALATLRQLSDRQRNV